MRTKVEGSSEAASTGSCPVNFVESVFSDYLERRCPDGALLVQGSWGAGKTLFWRTRLSALVESRKRPVLYLSVGGLEKASELDDALFQAAYPALNSAVGEVAKVLGRAALRKLSIESSDWKLKADALSGAVICVDDLERFEGKPQTLFSFLQEIVEHRRSHCVLLCDPAVMAARDSIGGPVTPYSKVLEKVVWKSICFRTDVEVMALDFVKALGSHQARDSLVQHFDVLKLVFQCAEMQNLRTVRFVVNSAADVLDAIQGVGIEDRSIAKLIAMTAVIALEHRSDSSRDEELRRVFREYGFIETTLRDKEGGKEDGLVPLSKKYAALSPLSWPTFPALVTKILDGWIEPSDLRKQALDAFPPEADLVARMSRDLWDMNDEELSQAVDEYVQVLLGEDPMNLQFIADRGTVMFWIAKESISKRSPQEILDLHKDALRRRYDKKRLLSSDDMSMSIRTSELKSFGTHAAEFAAELEMYREAILAREEADRRSVQLKLLQASPHIFFENVGEDDHWRISPLLVPGEVTPTTLASAMQSWGAPEFVNFNRFLGWRSSVAGIEKRLAPEREFVKAFIPMLESIEPSEGRPLAFLRLKGLISSLKKLDQSLSGPSD